MTIPSVAEAENFTIQTITRCGPAMFTRFADLTVARRPAEDVFLPEAHRGLSRLAKSMIPKSGCRFSERDHAQTKS
jgi:hypothetical protein